MSGKARMIALCAVGAAALQCAGMNLGLRTAMWCAASGGAQAVWTVTFDANGGVGEMAMQTYTNGVARVLSANAFSRAYHTFVGWGIAPDGAVAFADGATVSNLTAEADGRVTLYAVWAAYQYTLSFDANGGTEVVPVTQAYGTKVAAPAAPTRTGYTFAGWTPELPATMPAENLTFTAQWKANGLVVTFNANGGTLTDGALGTTRPTIEVSVEKGKVVGDLPKPTREGYTFNGWYTKTSGGTKIKTSTKVTKDVTYYAQWTVNKYTIKFDKNGGTGTMKSLAATYGKNVTLTANAFKKSNNSFLGWATEEEATAATYTDKQKVKNLSSKSGGTVTLYAVWKPYTYTVKFNKNGGTGSVAKQTLNCGSSVKLVKNEFVREGFKFAGWATKKGGKVEYKNKAKVKDLAKKGKSVTLYAVWYPADWAVGTFTGTGAIGNTKVKKRKAATVTLTVGSTGKISGKFALANGKSYSFKADAFTAFKDGALCVETTISYGSKKCVLVIAVSQDEEAGATVADLLVTYKGKEYGEASLR